MNYGILDPTYQIKETSAGLMHQCHYLISLYVQCKAKGYTPVKPRLILTGGHNNGHAKLLLDYVTLPSEFVDEIPINTSGNNIHVFSLYFHCPQIAKTLREKFPLHLKYKIIAESIIENLPRPILCVRVRRGDMMHVLEAANLTIVHINQVINRYTHSSVYLMTDDKTIDMIFFGDQTVKRLKRHVKTLENLIPNFENKFEREMCAKILKGTKAILEQQLFLEKKRTQ
jgi:hypothetical protein